MADKEVRELMEAIESGDHGPSGLKVVTEGKHAKIYFNGQPVHERLESGEMGAPLTLPLTPSDARWRENNVQRLIRSRVLRDDPKKVAQRGLTAEQEQEREAKRQQQEERHDERQEEVAAVAEEAKDKQANTTLLRQRAERLFESMGVWKPAGMGHSGWRGTIAEVARVSWHWAVEVAKLGDAPTEPVAKDRWRRLFRDEPVDEKGRAFINAFVDELDRADNATRLYHDYLRALLGVRETRAPAPSAAPGVEPEAKKDEGPPVASVREVVEAVENLGGVVTSAMVAEAIPDMNAKTKNWATWKAADMGLIQRLGRGKYAPLDYAPQEDDLTNGTVDEEPPIPDERPIIPVDLEEDAEVTTEQLENVVAPLIERLEAMAEDLARLQAGRAKNGGTPTLALECLTEMIGQHITVGGDENGGISEDVLGLIDKKRERSLELAKQVAALEVG